MQQSLLSYADVPAVTGPKRCILVTGPNASGKSTTVHGVVDTLEDARLFAVYADEDKRFNVTAPEQLAAVLELWRSPIPVLVFEGTNRITQAVLQVAQQDASRELTILVTTMTATVMRANLQRRCAKRGKTFRADYWTDSQCEYEGQRRYRRLMEKYGAHAQYVPIDADYNGVLVLSGLLQDAVTGALA